MTKTRATLRVLYKSFNTEISGLYMYNNFLPKNQKNNIEERSTDLNKSILNNYNNKSVLSKHRNLKSNEYYCPVEITDGSRKIKAQYFDKYGNERHKFTYFKGNDNVPSFIKTLLIPNIINVPEIKDMTEHKTLDWNFTFNNYSDMSEVGFHKDIKSNGEITMIYSLLSDAIFEILNYDITNAYKFPSNTLLIMTGAARWNHEHRVLNLGKNRMSLVLGLTISYKNAALNLIFGDRKYYEFTDEEKQIVNSYQDMILEEDGLILPNTAAEQDSIECIKLLKNKK